MLMVLYKEKSLQRSFDVHKVQNHIKGMDKILKKES